MHNILKNHLLFSMQRNDVIFPLVGVYAPNNRNMYLNYYMTGEHLSVHANSSPIQHLRRADNTDWYEMPIDGWDDPNLRVPLGSCALGIEHFDRKRRPSLHDSHNNYYDNAENQKHCILDWEAFEQAGYTSGGIGISALLLSSSDLPSVADAADEFHSYFPPLENEYFHGIRYPEKAIVLRFSDEQMRASGIRFGVSHKLNVRAKAGAGELLIKPLPKRGEDVIVDLGGWERS